ncbi:MAG: PTS sugar transporter subunit IIA [Desulfobacterales bacterium]
MKLTINDVARCLRLPVSTVERWIRQGRLPIQRTDDGYIFNESALEKWAAMYKLPFSLPEEVSETTQQTKTDNLLPAMKRGGLLYNIKGEDVETVLKNGVENIHMLSHNIKDTVYRGLLEREHMAPTGIGKGVAIPHPRDPLKDMISNALISTCFLETPVDFHAVDGMPVFVMFILLSPSTKTHLHLLSSLSFCIRNNPFVEFLKTAPDSRAFFSYISDFENRLVKGDRF